MALVMLSTVTPDSKATKLRILVLPVTKTYNRKTDTAVSLKRQNWPTCQDLLQGRHPRDGILLFINIQQQSNENNSETFKHDVKCFPVSE